MAVVARTKRVKSYSLWILILVALVAAKLMYDYRPVSLEDWGLIYDTTTTTSTSSSSGMPLSHGGEGSIHLVDNNNWNKLYPLAIPMGQAQNLPSIRIVDPNLDKKRDMHGIGYGGVGDGKHLGGFTELDMAGISPVVWSSMITQYGIKSFLDVGCGKGVSTRWFLEHGVDVLCAEGSHDAVEQTLLPADRVVEHDFSRGPWWPAKTYDAVWSVEFLEHVSRQYHFNYITAFRKAALIFVTSSRWGGWHHVEVHPDDWWIQKFRLYGFQYEPELTEEVKSWARQEASNQTFGLGPNGQRYGASHVMGSLKVFSNPVVGALPEHAHLFPRDGCFQNYAPKGSPFISITQPCSDKRGETELPESFAPLKITPDMHKRWLDAIQARLDANKKDEDKT